MNRDRHVGTYRGFDIEETSHRPRAYYITQDSKTVSGPLLSEGQCYREIDELIREGGRPKKEQSK